MSNFIVNPFTSLLDATGDSSGGSSSFITEGTSGISTIRMETSGGYVYDFTCDDTGAWVSTLVSSPGSGPTTGNPFSPLWFQGITYS